MSKRKHVGDSFPGFERCLAMMRKRDALMQEEGFHTLLPHVADYVDPLIAALCTEDDAGMQSWLLELLGEARSVRALPIFAEYIGHPNESLRRWAQRGIAELAKTHDGRRVLWHMHLHGEGLPTFSSEREAQTFRGYVAHILQEARGSDF